MSDDLLVERRNGVVTLTLNRPDKLNSITGAMWGGLRDVFDDVASNRDDRVLVITGAGKGFCAGADLVAQDMPRGTGGRLEHMRGVGRSAAALRDIGKPTIAKVNGVAAGGSWLLPRLIGVHKAKELAFLAEVIDATEAERIGIVNRIVPADELDD